MQLHHPLIAFIHVVYNESLTRLKANKRRKYSEMNYMAEKKTGQILFLLIAKQTPIKFKSKQTRERKHYEKERERERV